MNDTADQKTRELIPTPAKRGRPITGKAMSAAERKRAQRRRAIGIDAYNVSNSDDLKISEAPTTSLLERLGKLMRNGHPDAVRNIAEELVRRAEANNRDSH